MSLSSGGVPKYTPPKCYGKARGGIFRIMSQRLLCQKGLDSQSLKGRTLPCLSRVLAHAGARHAPNPTWIPSTASWLPFMIRCQSHTATHPPQPLVALVLLQVLAFHLFKILWTTSRALCLLSYVTLLVLSLLIDLSVVYFVRVHMGAHGCHPSSRILGNSFSRYRHLQFIATATTMVH